MSTASEIERIKPRFPPIALALLLCLSIWPSARAQGPAADPTLVATASVDGHASGDTVDSGTTVFARFKATDAMNGITQFNYYVYSASPPGSTPKANGATGTIDAGQPPTFGNAVERDASVTLTPGTWYFWTSAVNANNNEISSGDYGFVLNVPNPPQGPPIVEMEEEGRGGSPSLWFYALLAALAAVRFARNRRITSSSDEGSPARAARW